jgi:hypothetical protein
MLTLANDLCQSNDSNSDQLHKPLEQSRSVQRGRIRKPDAGLPSLFTESS